MRSSNQPVILFLDDDQDTRELVQLTLALAGIRVYCAKTRSEAWDIATANRFDLYLLDGKLPDGDSCQLCADLRELAPDKPIVFLSALVSPSYMQRAFDAGASAFLKKPFMGNLGEEILQLLRSSKRATREVNEDFVQDSVQIIEPFDKFERTANADDDADDDVVSFAKR